MAQWRTQCRSKRERGRGRERDRGREVVNVEGAMNTMECVELSL